MEKFLRVFRSSSIRIVLLVVVILALAGKLTACTAFFTIVPISEERQVSEGGSATNKGFDKVAYVDTIWESKVLPTVREKPVDFGKLYTELTLNQAEASQKYGNKVGGPYNFLTKFEGKVTGVDTSSRAGLINVDIQTSGGPVPVKVQIGPVLRGTAIRDALGFITFNEFVNQLQFADVADELNNRVLASSLKGVDPTSLLGKTVAISGAFTLDKLDDLTITPVFFEVK